MSLGSVYLGFRQKFGHGLRVAYYRDVVRPRILQTAPIENTTDTVCEIHVLTSAADWLNMFWTLKSFYWASARTYALCIHEDGSLPEEARVAIDKHFPAARLICRRDADARLEQELREFPRCLEFRRTNLLAPKIFDFAAYLESDRMAVFDSDLLFFAEPTEFLRRVEDPNYSTNTFNADAGESAYTVGSDVVQKCLRFELMPMLNSGLGLAHKVSIRWDWIEEFLALPGILEGHFWRIEQTLFALCSSRFGHELLPAEYSLQLAAGIGDRPFRHYVGAIRHLMYREGMTRLTRDGFLVQLGAA